MAIQKKTRKRNNITETYYQVTVSGYDKFRKRIQRKRRARNKAQAREIERQLFEELQRIKKIGYEKTFTDFLPEYLDHLEIKKKKTKGTIASERAALTNHALPLIGNLELRSITTAHIDHIIEVKLENRSSQTKKHCLRYLNALFKLAIKKHYCDSNPCDDVEGIKVTHRAKTILNFEQLTKLLQTVEDYFPEWLPHFMIVVHCALRAAEARGLQWGDIDWNNNIVYINRTLTTKNGIKPFPKNGKPRPVPLSPELKTFLLAEKERLQPNDNEWVLEQHTAFMRDEQAKVVRDTCKIAGIPECTFHQLRAASITNMLRRNIPIGTVMKIAGHSRLSSTDIYYDSSGEPVRNTTDHIAFFSDDKSKNN